MPNARAVCSLLILLVGGGVVRAADGRPDETALDRYVARPDSSYSWRVVSDGTRDGLRVTVVRMVSQTWRTASEVDRPQWWHWLTITRPEALESDIGLLMIGGGGNDDEAPGDASEEMKEVARASQTAVAELHMVPNQPLVFHGDGQRRSEDDLIGYTWDQYIETGDETWPARNPMIKSAVRAMDTVTAVLAVEEYGGHAVERFVVAGGSKRGWTTWLTAALDDRVVGIIPIVIDVLNVDVSMRHQMAAYGFWAPSVGDYLEHRIMQRLDHPRTQELLRLVDPYHYRHRLTMPKLILNAAGDQFFLPDSSQFYLGELEGESHLRYVPNTDHSLGGSDALSTFVAFYDSILTGTSRPKLSWSFQGADGIHVRPGGAAQVVTLWQAHNPRARDFRLEEICKGYESSTLESAPDGSYSGKVTVPEEGWTAFFVEATYDLGLAAPLKLTTAVRVVPNTLPHSDKDPTLGRIGPEPARADCEP